MTTPSVAPPKARKLTATLPDGTVVTRRTARDYQYVVCSRPFGKESWRVCSWTARDPQVVVSEELRRLRGFTNEAHEFVAVPAGVSQ